MNAQSNTEPHALAAPPSSESTAPKGILDVGIEDLSSWELLGVVILVIVVATLLGRAFIWFEEKVLGLTGADY